MNEKQPLDYAIPDDPEAGSLIGFSLWYLVGGLLGCFLVMPTVFWAGGGPFGYYVGQAIASILAIVIVGVATVATAAFSAGIRRRLWLASIIGMFSPLVLFAILARLDP